MNLCILGGDPFGAEIDALQGKLAAGRKIALQRKAVNDSVQDCQVVFVAAAAMHRLPRLLASLGGSPVFGLFQLIFVFFKLID